MIRGSCSRMRTGPGLLVSFLQVSFTKGSLIMSKVRVLTPVVALKDNMEGATALALDGLAAGRVRVGFLDNTKPNCGQLFGYIADLLKERGVAASTFNLDKTDTPGNPASGSATEAAFNQLKQKADFVITGLGN